MSTKLNAEELATERYPEIAEHTDSEAHFRDGCKAGYFFAIHEVAQPIADQRDELLKVAELAAKLNTQTNEIGSGMLAELVQRAKAAIAKAKQP